jgi:hypothetical protein
MGLRIEAGRSNMAVTSRSKNRVRAGTTLVAIAFLVAACGSSGSKAASPGSSSLSKSSTGASQAPAPSASSKPPKVAKAGSGGSFCDKARSEEAASAKDAAALTTGNPQQLEQLEEKELSELKGFVSSAPSQIKGAVAILAAGDQKLFNALKAANFDFTKLSPATVGAFDTPEFTQATDQITAYLASTCGISPSDVPTP